MRERKGTWFLPLLLSLLFHLLLFIGLSLHILWPVSVSAKIPVRLRIVSIDLPKPKEDLPPDPNSRFLSDVNRRESGAGKPRSLPRLKRDTEDRLPARRGSAVPEAASFPPPPQVARVFPQFAPPAAEISLPEPESPRPDEKNLAVPVRKEKPPPESKPENLAGPEPPRPDEKNLAVPVRKEKPPPESKPENLAGPEPRERAKPDPAKKPVAAIGENVSKPVLPQPEEKSPPPPGAEKRPKAVVEERPKVVVKERPNVVLKKAKLAPQKVVEERPNIVVKKAKPAPRKVEKPVRRKPKKRIEVASLPKPRPALRKVEKPAQRRLSQRPKPPVDRIAMFRRVKPRVRGRPDAPDINLSDEDEAQIAKAGVEERIRAEEGEAVSLNTRDFRYASYFAHLKKRIKEAWTWPEEARKYWGRLQLRFVIRDDGRLHRVVLLKSSGYRILDEEALSAIAKAAPFKPFPPEIKRKLLPIHGSFIYD